MRFEPGFLASVAVILIAARLLGEGAQRLGQPAVIGQLAAGVLLGPTVFGLLWPAAQHELFPPGPAERAPLQAFAEFGILLLLVLTGMEVDLRLLRKVGRPAISVSLAGVAAPFACGAAVGFLLPDGLLPKPEERLATALFLGVALSISSIKIVASVVRDMGFARRDLGQTLVAASIVEDSIGWILLAVILGVVGARGGPAGGAAQSAVGVAAFLGVSLTVGRPLVAHLIRAVNDEFQSEFMVLSLILAIAIAFALATQALGVQTVLGAFVAGVLVGESPILTGRVAAQLRAM
ncbi:MAG: cation:proton antiporter, partial [Hyphomicrobiales bacterium]|nr:cation:proton antiporter [Hyphomicrobiales bacterium]